jgi:hypothetical protein
VEQCAFFRDVNHGTNGGMIGRVQAKRLPDQAHPAEIAVVFSPHADHGGVGSPRLIRFRGDLAKSLEIVGIDARAQPLARPYFGVAFDTKKRQQLGDTVNGSSRAHHSQ